MKNRKDLKEEIKEVPLGTYKEWDDDGKWERVAVLEMSRNFGVAGSELVHRFDALIAGKDSDGGIDGILSNFSTAEMKQLRDLIDDLHFSRLNNIQIDQYENSKRSYRATRGNLRITCTLATDWAKIWRNKKPPYGFMVDIIARKK